MSGGTGSGRIAEVVAGSRPVGAREGAVARRLHDTGAANESNLEASDMIPDRGRDTLLTVLGVSAGLATGVWLWRQRGGRQQEPARPWARPRGSAQDVSESLRKDPKLARRRIEVDAIAEGVIELSGSVQDRAEAERAMGIAQATTGVYTVVNRLRLEEEESHRETTRRRWTEGAPDLRERHHYGMGVGMGPRRQAPDTDPDRPSDKQKILERELDVANIEDTPESGPDPISGAEAVDNADMKPGDERAIQEAGLDASPRPNSTPKQSVPDTADGNEAPGTDDRD